MTGIDPRTPCLIGAADATWRDEPLAPEPLSMWEQVARSAAADSAATGDVLSSVDSVQVVYCQSWQYDDAPARLAERLGARTGGHRLYSGIGGSTPQRLAVDTFDQIRRGDVDLAVIAGGEALATKRRYKKQGERPPWTHRATEKRPFPMEAMPPAAEMSHQVFQAYLTFALFDSARRAHLGIPVGEHREQIGHELAALSRVAATNPAAWFPQAHDAEALITATADNRMVATPYTKQMVAVMDIDSAGALLLASEAKADELGVPRERRVYPRGWGFANDPWVVAQHPMMHASPALAAAGRAAFDMAGVSADDLGPIDLYSCFASSISFARDALGVSRPDVTVTGGLPYYGGAGSAYMVMSIAALAQRLRLEPGVVGMATGVGMHMTKHAVGLWSTDAGPATDPTDASRIQTEVDTSHPAPALLDNHDGVVTVLADSVLYGRDNEPERAVFVCETPEGSRCYAQSTDADIIATAAAAGLAGTTASLTATESVNILTA